MKLVTIDASAVASWIFPSQATREADAFLRERDRWRFIAPNILVWEMGNQILNRARKTGEPSDELLSDFRILDVEIAVPAAADAVLSGIEAAQSRRLSLFDNAYLELCIRQDAALASCDADLLQAALRFGVEIFDLRD